MSAHAALIRIRRRRRQARWLLKRLPRRASIHTYPLIGRFAARVRAPFFWTWRGWPLIASLYAAALITCLPLMGFQIPLALGAAALLRANLPIAIGLQFVSNPLTAAPLYGLTLATGWWPLTLVSPQMSIPLHTALALTLGGLVWGLILAGALHLAHAIRTQRHRRDLQILASSAPDLQTGFSVLS